MPKCITDIIIDHKSVRNKACLHHKSSMIISQRPRYLFIAITLAYHLHRHFCFSPKIQNLFEPKIQEFGSHFLASRRLSPFASSLSSIRDAGIKCHMNCHLSSPGTIGTKKCVLSCMRVEFKEEHCMPN